MSTATKRKHVTKEIHDDLRVPTDSQLIAQLVGSRGNNLHEVVDSRGDAYLVTMPVKFRRNIWVKTRDYVLIEPIAEGVKVKAEIVKILTKDHIKFYKSQDCWPKIFVKDVETATTDKNDSSEDDDDKDLFVNTNGRPSYLDERNNESSSSESSNAD